MTWEKVPGNMWKAVGKNGKFYLWREHGKWTGRYCSHDEKKKFRLPYVNTDRQIKALCEENHYWEEA